MEKNLKIYLAGHNGMVGSAIYRKLIAEGYSNIVTKNYHELDLSRQSEVELFFEKEQPDYVIIAAAKVGGIVANNTYRAEFIYENLMIQNNVIHSAWSGKVKKLLFLGSSCIYPRLAPQPLQEDYLLTGPLEFTNEPYAIAKIAGIKMCESYYRQYGSDFISVMPTNLFGPNDNYDLEKSHVLPALIRKMHLGKCLESQNWKAITKDMERYPIKGLENIADKKSILEALSSYGIQVSQVGEVAEVSISLWGSGEVYREFLYVEDMADACVFLMNNLSASTLYDELNHTHVNIGTGKDITIKELSSIVKKVTGFNGKIHWDTSRPDGTPKKLLDTALINSMNWKYKTELEDGIRKVYDIYQNP